MLMSEQKTNHFCSKRYPVCEGMKRVRVNVVMWTKKTKADVVTFLRLLHIPKG